MMPKIFIIFSILFVVASAENTSDENNWSCKATEGTPCSGNMMMVRPSHWNVPVLNASTHATCMSTDKADSNSFPSTKTTMYNDRVVMSIKCLNPSTPCITSFKICIQDHRVQPMTLHCRFVKDFQQTEDENDSTDSHNEICGANGAKTETYSMDTGFVVTKFDFNCEQIVFEKPVPESEPTKK